ncbi:MAG: hypothetical protein C0507_09840 [Cyanobacteria bacterium PR.3.49]|nr:hypothetical protein [Cyanobacteria bacterium PR.3.49]
MRNLIMVGTARRNCLRKPGGISIILLAVILAAFAAVPLGLLGFEIQRVQLAREQLRSVCEAASLAAATELAGSDLSNALEAHQNAIDAALAFYQQNSVIGYALNTSYLAGSKLETPSITKGNLYVEFLDPHSNLQPVSIGDPRGKIVRVYANINALPAFGKFLPIGNFIISANAAAGVPALDVVLCFDISGSIDDQTFVSFVRRQWDATAGKIIYPLSSARGGAPAGSTAKGKLYDVLGPPPTGSRTNAVFPQWLSVSNQSDHRYPLNFSEEGSAKGLRGSSDSGSPPGNCPPGKASTGDNYTYTDLVVNLDNNQTFGGISVDGYDFPDIATLVEASRGNLESTTVFTSSQANKGLPNITPRAGYKSEYQKIARTLIHPLLEAQDAASTFLSILNTNADARFGFVSFATDAGKSPGDYEAQSNVDASYPQAGSSNFPMPGIKLSSAEDVTNFSTIMAAIPTTGACTGTNIGDSLIEAVNQLKTYGRKGASKAIVLFTDGQPTVGSPLDADPWANSRKAAVEAKKAGIPIYTIGLAQNPEIVPSEVSILNDTNSNPSNGGIAAIAGNGGKFFLVTDAMKLRLTFENVARQLVQLVR